MAKLSYAVLIDGGFVKYALKTSKDPISGQDVRLLIDAIGRLPCVMDMRLHRVYFYDAKPLTGKYKHPDGTELDFSASAMAVISQRQHNEVGRLPYVAMRFGELSYRGWRVKERVIKAAKAPIPQLARREGVQMTLVTLGKHVKEGMCDHADVVVDSKAVDLLKP